MSTDDIAEKQRREKIRSDLYWAMRTRVLTDQEMETVRKFDVMIATPINTTGQFTMIPTTARDEFNKALYHQAMLRIAAEKKV